MLLINCDAPNDAGSCLDTLPEALTRISKRCAKHDAERSHSILFQAHGSHMQCLQSTGRRELHTQHSYAAGHDNQAFDDVFTMKNTHNS